MGQPKVNRNRVARARAPKLSRDERVAAILVVARKHFCRLGFAAASVADMASEIGVSEATVFKYFASKRELLNRVIENWYGELFGDYSRELSVIDGARIRFRFLVWRHLSTLRQSPEMCRLIFSEVRSQADYHRSPTHRMNLRYTALLTEVIREGSATGEFRADLPVDLLRDLVYGGIEHHAWRYLYGSGRLEVEKVADQLVGLLCAGIANPGSAERADARLPTLVARLEQAVESLAKGSRDAKP